MKRAKQFLMVFVSLGFLSFAPSNVAFGDDVNSYDGDMTVMRTPPLPPQPRPPGRDRPLPPPEYERPVPPPPRDPNPYPPRPRPPYDPDPRPYPPDYGYYEQPVSRHFGRWFYDESLNLTRLLGLNRYRGYEIDHVEIRVRSGADGRANVKLYVDDYLEATDVPTDYVTYLEVRGFKRVNRDPQQVELTVSGGLFIESITVYLYGSRW